MSAPAKPDTTNLSPEEQRLFRMYGKLPAAKRLTGRKYFDSGDYALAKAGNPNVTVGTAHPTLPRNAHPAPTGLHQSTSPLNDANIASAAQDRIGQLSGTMGGAAPGGPLPAHSRLAGATGPSRLARAGAGGVARPSPLAGAESQSGPGIDNRADGQVEGSATANGAGGIDGSRLGRSQMGQMGQQSDDEADDAARQTAHS